MGRINLGSGGAGIGSPNINKAATTAGKKARAVNAKLRAELQRAQAQSQQHLREIAGLRRDMIAAMQALDDLVALSGRPEGSTDLGTFTGDVLTDNATVKAALQEIETALEGHLPVIVEVHNPAAGTLSKGTAVYVTGTHTSGKPTIATADANGPGTYPAMGLVFEDISAGGDGFVIISGFLDGLDTDTPGWNAGDALYVDTTPGDLTTTRPTATSTKVQKVALVARRHATAGSVILIGAGRTNDIPNELVTLTGVSLNDSDLGTFTGSIITANSSIKTALQELETATDAIDLSSKYDVTGGTISGAVTIDYSSTADPALTIESDDPSSDAAPIVDLIRNSSSPSNGDYLGQIKFKGENSTGGSTVYAKITGKIQDVTNGSEDGLIEFAAQTNSIMRIMMRLTGSGGNPELKLINGTDLDLDTGDITLTGTVDGRDVSTDGGVLDDLVTLSGVAANDTDLGTFTGGIITANSSIKPALQDLETDVVEAKKGERFSEYRVTTAADINAAPPYQFTFNVAHIEDTNITTRTTANTRIEIQEDGVYQFDFRSTYYSTTAFIGLYVYISINGVIAKYGGAEGLIGGATAPFSSSNGSHMEQLSSGDYVEMFITRHASTTGATYAHSDHTYLRVVKMGDAR